MRTSNILHITPHLGGGVGSVLWAWFAHEFKTCSKIQHCVALLDVVKPAIAECYSEFNVSITQNLHNDKRLLSMIFEADIVLVHWWNHPLLYDFLVRTSLPPVRVVFWSHISGVAAPYVFSPKLFEYADCFVFTTPISYETEIIRNIPHSLREKISVIWATSGVSRTRDITLKPHKGFNAGYIGTVDYAKLHPDFLTICARAAAVLPDAHFYVCGGPCHEQLQIEASKHNLDSRVTFLGHVDNIAQHLAQFDVFFYPLAPHHFGTCDQVLAEAMAATLPPVVLNNSMERTMVQDGVTGLVASSVDEFLVALERLHDDHTLRRTLGANARADALERYVVGGMASQWHDIFEKMLRLPSKARQWPIVSLKDSQLTYSEIFVESLAGSEPAFDAYLTATDDAGRSNALRKIGDLGLHPRWQSVTKGTVHQYYSFFPNDNMLKIWSMAMAEQKNFFPELEHYHLESLVRVAEYKKKSELQLAAHSMFKALGPACYPYNFFWLGIPILQIPQDLQALQEIIWEVKPDRIIETGIAWGGSLMFSASMLCILETCGLIENGLVVGVDIEIRHYNKKNILNHPLSKKIRLLEGSSIDEDIICQIRELTQGSHKVLVCLDSNHSHDHVLAELRAYGPMVSRGSYCVVMDTTIEDYDDSLRASRPWHPGNSPKTAVRAFLKENSDFIIDEHLEAKLVLTGSPEGWLRRMK